MYPEFYMSFFSLHRWWQSLGFGIQSKTDFAFLHDVLKERLPYYIYDELEEAFPKYSRRAHRQAQLLFRICNHFRNKRILCIGKFNELDKKAIDHALTQQAEYTERILSKISADIIIINDINKENGNLWSGFIQGNNITYDMVNLGIVIHYENRFPEHYEIQRL